MKQPEALPATDIGDALVAGGILSNYNSEMKSRSITGSDQFYHCLAACRANQVTSNPRVVLELMALKEVKDYYGAESVSTETAAEGVTQRCKEITLEIWPQIVTEPHVSWVKIAQSVVPAMFRCRLVFF